MDDYDGAPRRRGNDSAAAPVILDRDEQERVIAELQDDYHRMIRAQRRGFIAFAGALCIGCAGCFARTGDAALFLSAAIAFIALLIGEMTRARMRWQITAAAECVAAAFALRSASPRALRIAVHAVFALAAALGASLDRARKALPDEIARLKSLRYGPKLA